MSPKQTRNKEATRLALLGAARKAFAESGFEGARNQAIADAAGTNKAMINYHFGGKKGLFSAVILHDIAAVKRALAPAEAADTSPLERLDALVSALAGALGDNPAFPLILVREQMSGAHRLDPEVRQEFFGFFRLTRSILEDGIAQAAFREADAHAVHLCMVGSLVYFLMTGPARETYVAQGTMPSPAPDWQQHVSEVRNILRHGLEALPGRRQCADGDAAGKTETKPNKTKKKRRREP